MPRVSCSPSDALSRVFTESLGTAVRAEVGHRGLTRVLILGMASQSQSSRHVFLIGALGVLLRPDLAIGSALLGSLVAAYFVSAAVTALSGGRLVERLGAGRSLRLGALMTLASLWAAALAGIWWVFFGAALIPLLVIFGATRGTTATPLRRRLREGDAPVAPLVLLGLGGGCGAGAATGMHTFLVGWAVQEFPNARSACPEDFRSRRVVGSDSREHGHERLLHRKVGGSLHRTRSDTKLDRAHRGRTRSRP